jgi:acyl carrier protein
MTDKTQVAALVRQTIATALGRPVNPEEDVRQTEEPRWDSLKHVEIMLMVEETFGIVLDPEDFALMTSVESCVTRVIAHLDRRASG